MNKIFWNISDFKLDFVRFTRDVKQHVFVKNDSQYWLTD